MKKFLQLVLLALGCLFILWGCYSNEVKPADAANAVTQIGFFATIGAALVFGTFWFWAIVVFFIIVEICFLEKDDSGGFFMTVLIVAFLFYLDKIAKLPLFELVFSRWYFTVGGVVAYLGIGIFWSGIKWGILVRKNLQSYKEERTSFLKNVRSKWERGIGYQVFNHMQSAKDNYPEMGYFSTWCKQNAVINEDTEIPDFLDSAFASYLDDNYRSSTKYEPARASEHKDRIYKWIAFWPFSMLWSLLDDFIKNMIHWLIDTIKVIYQKITKLVYGKSYDEIQRIQKAKKN